MEMTITLNLANPQDRIALRALEQVYAEPHSAKGNSPATPHRALVHDSVVDAPDLAAIFGAGPLAPAAPVAAAEPSQTAPEVPDGTSTSTTAAPPAPPEPPADATPVPAERDSANLPWDERIHGSTRSKNKDGTWRAKRNISDLLVTQVNQELKAIDAAHALTAPPAHHAAPAPPLPPTGVPITFGQVVVKVQNAMSAKLMDTTMLGALLAKHGASSLPLLASRPDLFAAFAAEVPELPA